MNIDYPEQSDQIEKMMDKYGSHLYRLCAIYLKDADIAKDAVLDTFIKAFRHLNKFDKRSLEDTASQITLTILDRAPEDMHNGSYQTAYSRTCGCITEPAGEGLYRTRYTCIINLDEYPDHEIWIWPTYSSQGCVHMVFD